MQIAGREYTVVRPRIRDPRFHLAAVIISLHALGQTVLSFEISIAQILISVGTAAAIGFCTTLVRERIIAWPASAVLAGNGVAFLLRVPGTVHGDWWAVRGWWIFSGTAALALASKYLIKWQGSHVFNPSNFALVVCFLALGSNRVEPLDFWWGPLSLRIGAAIAVIVIGGIAILMRLKIATIAISFWLAFAASIGLLALSGHEMTARWNLGPVTGWQFWWVVALSPETLVFLFFMITDPKTSPAGRVARCCYGASIGLLAGLFVAPQRTEFATKVAVLGALTVVCAIRRLVEARLPAPGSANDRVIPFFTDFRRVPARSFVVLVAFSLATMSAISINHRATTTDELSGPQVELAGKRPTIDEVEIALPTVRVDGSDRVSSSISKTTAEAIARDLVDNFAIFSLARERNDIDLLATAAAESLLQRLQRSFRDVDQQQPLFDRYDIEAVTISIARRSGQGAPAVMVTLRGTARRSPTRADPHNVRTVHETYEVKFIRNHYLVTTDDIPTGFTPP